MVAAYLEVERETCPTCHTRRDEWGYYDDAGVFHEYDDPPYVARSTADPGCAAMDRKQAADSSQMKGDLPPGYRVTLWPSGRVPTQSVAATPP